MHAFLNAIDRDGEAFRRAFESAGEIPCNPEARSSLHRAVEELVANGALLPQEALTFESSLLHKWGAPQSEFSTSTE